MSLSSSWKPKRTYEEVDKLLCAPGSLLELQTQEVDGLVQRVYKNLWPSLRAFWLHVSKQHADKLCIVYENQRLTFREVADRAAQVASVCRDIYGIKKGDRVAICSRNYPEYLIVFWACHLIGAVSVLVNAWMPVETIKHVLINTQCSLVFLDSERADQLSSKVADIKSAAGTKGFIVVQSQEGKGSWSGMETWKSRIEQNPRDARRVLEDDPKILPEDNATILFTSGTGGLPKGCLSTQRAFLTNLFNSLSSIGRATLRRGEEFTLASPPGPQPGIFLPSPLFHSAGLSLVMIQSLTGAKLVMIRQWNVEKAAELIKKEMIVITGGVQSMIGDLAGSSAKGAPLRTILYGGAPVSEHQAKRAREAFPTASLSHAYGLTETNAGIVAFGGEDYEARLKSCGRPMPVNDILIMNENGVRCPTGTAGEVWLRGPNLMKCYWGDAVATSKALTKDGWLKSGDVGYVDEEGFLYIKDRLKDIIIRGGENIDSVLVQNTLYADEGVLEVAAVGVPDARLGELVTALVTVKPSHKGKVTEASLMNLARKHLPVFAVPVMILISEDEFPHTPTGKIIKVGLRKIAAEEWTKRQKSGPTKGKL
ncbi:hypothetical protein GYMLUDRAFT_36078 [Collybiopsis luxurians FD-317 M1]|nr:hypothetical protein GYMLUDRAFT_36078 [Collybiopsis luxurians FD-317 M1]